MRDEEAHHLVQHRVVRLAVVLERLATAMALALVGGATSTAPQRQKARPRTTRGDTLQAVVREEDVGGARLVLHRRGPAVVLLRHVLHQVVRGVQILLLLGVGRWSMK